MDIPDTDQILDIAEVMLLVLDSEGRVARINRKGCEILGLAEADVVGKCWFTQFIPPRMRDGLRALLTSMLSGEKQAEYYENPILIGDGSEREMAWHNSVLIEQGKPVGTFCSGLEIDARRVAEQVHQTILDTVIDAIVSIDEQGLIGSFNSAAERIFGYRQGEVVGRPVEILMPEPFRSEHAGYLLRYLQTREPRIIGIGRELTGVRKDGTVFPIHLGVGEAIIGERHYFTGIIRDLSEQKRRETELMAAREALMLQTLFAQRLQALAEMAGGISHELNQPLGSIRMYAETMSMMLRRGAHDSLAGTLEKIRNQVDRAASVIRHMREFAATDRLPEAKPVGLRDCVTGALDLLGTQLAMHRIQTQVEIPEDLIVMADGHRIEQVICNLLANARDSIDEKQAGAGQVSLHGARRGNKIELLVSDSGSGIPPALVDRIFEPFITSKGPDRGTGLGLSISHGILKDYGAEIKVRKSDGDGTTFALVFPAAPDGD
jgi:two-component system sensor kinase FixL